MRNKSFLSTRALVSTGVAAAISFILMQLDFPLPFAPAFVKLDISDIPSLILTFGLGPLPAVICELLKNLLHLFVTSTSGVGELSNFILGCLFVIPAGFIYKKNKTRKTALIAMLVGTLSFSIGAIFTNLFIMFPFYTTVSGISMDAIIAMCSKLIPYVDTEIKVILLSVTPFNILKGTLVSLITFFIYKPLAPIIKSR